MDGYIRPGLIRNRFLSCRTLLAVLPPKWTKMGPGQATVPGESQADVSIHGLWKLVTTALFDMRIFNLDAVSYLRQTSAKALETAEK